MIKNILFLVDLWRSCVAIAAYAKRAAAIFASRLGDLSYSVIRDAPFPVLSL
jgi:hypothetical protein